MEQGNDKGLWKPENYARRFYGLSTLRLGMEKSRNLMTVRMAQEIGMNKISAYARRFDITPNMPRVLAMALGAGETTLMRLTSAYAMLVNGGARLSRFSLTVFRIAMAPRSIVRTRDPVLVAMPKFGPIKSLPICRTRAKKCCRRRPPIRLFPCSKVSLNAAQVAKFTRWETAGG